MINSLTVAIPKNVLSREGHDSTLLQSFEKVTGIRKTRRWQGTTTQLAIRAALAHKAQFPCEMNMVGAVMVITQSPDRKSPCIAVEVHRELGLDPDCPAFDINQSCDGFVYGLWIAGQLEFTMGPVLVICVDMLRAPMGTLDDLIFSDGACAFIVNDVGGMSEPIFLTDGSGAKHLCADSAGLLQMDGGKVFDFVTKKIPAMIKEFDTKSGEESDLLCQHQPNLSIMQLVEKRSGFDGMSLRSVEEYGNMSMVSIAATLAHNEQAILTKGAELGREVSILLVGYGAGWSAAAMAVNWPEKKISQIVEVE